MKTRRLVWSMVALFIVSAASSLVLYLAKKDYDKKILDVDYGAFHLYSSLIETYYHENKVYPESLSFLYNLYATHNSEEIDWLEERFFIDPLSRKRGWVCYVPIYDDDENIVTFLLLSAGVDGKINNKVSSMRLKRDNWSKILLLYNPPKEQDTMVKIDKKFRLSDFLWGRKDLLLYNRDYVEDVYYD